MKKQLLILTLGLMVVGMKTAFAEQFIYFFNGSSQPKLVSLTHQIDINECIFGIDCKHQTDIGNLFKINPGERLFVRGSYWNFRVMFHDWADKCSEAIRLVKSMWEGVRANNLPDKFHPVLEGQYGLASTCGKPYYISGEIHNDYSIYYLADGHKVDRFGGNHSKWKEDLSKFTEVK